MSILVMSDIHGNLEALKAVLKNTAGEYNEIWVLGDIVGYGPDPGHCLDLLESLGAIMVAGNHDWAVCNKVDTGCFVPDAQAAISIHQKILSDSHKQFLANLPVILKRRSVTLSHANPNNPIWGYVLDTWTARSVLLEAQTSLTLVGHSHIAALWKLTPQSVEPLPLPYGKPLNYMEGLYLANPGSVGQSRDGNSAARYIILDPIHKTIVFRECKWSKRPLIKKMTQQGYPPTLISRMSSGR